MGKIIFAGCLAAILAACTTNDRVIAGAATGAGAGAIVGGPVGAIAGGAMGAFAGPMVTGSINRSSE